MLINSSAQYSGKKITKKFDFFILSNINQKKGELARLISPLESSGGKCLYFWYHAYGLGTNLFLLNIN